MQFFLIPYRKAEMLKVISPFQVWVIMWQVMNLVGVIGIGVALGKVCYSRYLHHFNLFGSL